MFELLLLTQIFNVCTLRIELIYICHVLKGLLGGPSDDYFSALRTAVRCISDPKKYYAKVR